MLVTSIFSFSHNVFYTIKQRNFNLWYIQIVVCRHSKFGLVQNFVVWERVKVTVYQDWTAMDEQSDLGSTVLYDLF